MNSGQLLAVTISEFIVWYNWGELKILKERLIKVPLDISNRPIPDPLRIKSIEAVLPCTDIEDDHNIILVLLNGTGKPYIDETDKSICDTLNVLTFESVVDCFPITERGAPILKNRLAPFAIKISEPLPVFDKMWSSFCTESIEKLSHKGGNSLLETVVTDPTLIPSNQLISEAHKSISIYEQGKAFPLKDYGLLVNVFCYNRHSPDIPDSDLGFLIDLGFILKGILIKDEKSENQVQQLREFLPDLKESAAAEILADKGLIALFNDIEDNIDEDNDLAGCFLFLKWKARCQKTDALDIELLQKDIITYSGKVKPTSIEYGIWLLGFFWGFNRFAKEYYQRKKGISCISSDTKYTKSDLESPLSNEMKDEDLHPDPQKEGSQELNPQTEEIPNDGSPAPQKSPTDSLEPADKKETDANNKPDDTSKEPEKPSEVKEKKNSKGKAAVKKKTTSKSSKTKKTSESEKPI